MGKKPTTECFSIYLSHKVTRDKNNHITIRKLLHVPLNAKVDKFSGIWKC